MVSSDESSSSDYYDERESSSGSSTSSSSETTQNLQPMSSEVSLELIEVSGDEATEFDMMTIVPKNIIFDSSTGFVLGYRYRTILKP